jgi:hypothetical protein
LAKAFSGLDSWEQEVEQEEVDDILRAMLLRSHLLQAVEGDGVGSRGGAVIRSRRGRGRVGRYSAAANPGSDEDARRVKTDEDRTEGVYETMLDEGERQG